jgi:PKD repeat protein
MKTRKTTLLIVVFFFYSILSANKIACLMPPPPVPSNDLCENAILLNVGTTCNYSVYDQTGATSTAGVPAPGCDSTTFKDVWFKFIVPAGGNVIVDTQEGSLNNSGMALYSGSCSNLTLISCNDDKEYGNSMSKIYQYGLTTGTTIYIRIWGASNSLFPNTGSFGICVKETSAMPNCGINPIANDSCTNATSMLNYNPYCGNTCSTYTALNSHGINENDTQLGNVFCGSIENNSWFKFLAENTTASFDIFVNNCLNNNGIQMEVFETMDCDSYIVHSNCWNPGVLTNGEVEATGLTPGNIYYIMIDGNAGDNCDYKILPISGLSVADSGYNVSICYGSSVKINAKGGISYSWSPTIGISNPTIANPIASPTTTTTYTATITQIDGSTVTSHIVVTVSQTVGGSLSSGVSQISLGESTGNINLTGQTGSVLKWQKRLGINNWIDILNYTTTLNDIPNIVGTWEYRALVQNDSCSIESSTSKFIDVLISNAGAVTGGNTPICIGNSTDIMTLGGYNGTILKWQKRVDGGSWIDISNTTTTYDEIPSSFGTWEYRAVINNGTVLYSAPTSILVDQLPTSQFTYSANSLSVSFTNQSTNATSYSWDFGSNSATSNDPNPEFTFPSSGQYSVVLTSFNGTCSASTSQLISVTEIKIEEIENQLYRIYPNPTSGKLSIQFGNQITKNTEINVIDITGKIVYKETISTLNPSQTMEIDLSKLGSGVYHIQLKNKSQLIDKVIIIER